MILDLIYTGLGLAALALGCAMLYPPAARLFGRNSLIEHWRQHPQIYSRPFWLSVGGGLLLLAAAWLIRGTGAYLGIETRAARGVKDVLQLAGVVMLIIAMIKPVRAGKS